jgi:hypothetical protein
MKCKVLDDDLLNMSRDSLHQHCAPLMYAWCYRPIVSAKHELQRYKDAFDILQTQTIALELCHDK